MYTVHDTNIPHEGKQKADKHTHTEAQTSTIIAKHQILYQTTHTHTNNQTNVYSKIKIIVKYKNLPPGLKQISDKNTPKPQTKIEQQHTFQKSQTKSDGQKNTSKSQAKSCKNP